MTTVIILLSLSGALLFIGLAFLIVDAIRNGDWSLTFCATGALCFIASLAIWAFQ